jgi:hypothetical protein
LNHSRTDGDTLLNCPLSCAKAGLPIARTTSPARNIIDFVTAPGRQHSVVLALSLMAHRNKFKSAKRPNGRVPLVGKSTRPENIGFRAPALAGSPPVAGLNGGP